VIGSEMSGSVRKITISNCVFDGTERGIRIKTTRGRGGVVEEIRVSNIIMKNIGQQAVVLDMQYSKTDPEPVSERTPQFKNIHFGNLTGQTNEAIYINGLAEIPVEDITFNDIQFDAKTGARIKEAKNIEFHNVRVTTKEGSSLMAENVSGLVIDNFKTLNPISDKPTIDMKNVKDVFLYNNFPVKNTTTFLHVGGDKSKNIVLKNNNWVNSVKPLMKEAEVTESIQVD